jgi:zinc protease
MNRIGPVLLLCAAVLAGPAASQERFRRTPPPPDPLPGLRLPPIEESSIPNGLRIAAVPWTGAPLMSLQLILDAGESRSPENLPGLATCAAHLFLRGTRFRSGEDIEDLIESLGGRITLDVTQDHVFFTFLFLEEALDQVLNLLREMLIAPGFSERELANLKFSLRYDLIDKNKDPEIAARRQLLRLLFQGHPYARFAFDPDVIKNWTMRDLAAFFDRYYRPNAAHLVFVGDIQGPAATKKAARFLSVWQARDIPALSMPAPRVQDRDRVCFIDIPEAKVCAVAAGVVLPNPDPSERFTLSVLNQILGGTTGSRLFMTLREAKGLAFSAFSEIDYFRSGAVFVARSLNPVSTIVPAVQEMIKILRSPGREPIPPDEIELAKSTLIGNFPLRLGRFEDFVARAGLIEAVGWGPEAWNRYYEPMWMVGPERVADAAARVFQSRLVVVIAGDKRACDERLADFETVEYYDSKGQYQYRKDRNAKEP